ncbi:hypothetical protein TCAL_07989 [Tigriopus californicus]|uniref:L-Fucosyltransferase n=3 Tax=Tigriopus californicus TaxID=6832 RepID=A0A553N723_TIGCA|nr:hypothetical protein TCAL_07989 [Tigriopus californicus]|eukprot:TCALIF_07989-PA protein Name:"Similar to Sec1 Galactoside 2-alpha-L-fucosyltransferase 3 (Mus musculus)" AED:0.05 eAED:0.05 QI:93/1/0.5/1/1/0.5/2/0/209
MAAQTWLLQRHADLQSQLFEWVNPIWIGLHVRRTDYERVLSRRNASLVELEYFERAIREMKAIILGAEIAQHSKMVFVVASDDPAWCMQQLPRIPGEKFIFTNENDAIHIQDNGLESDFQVAFDLCVMSLCNHSIYDYGTFAFWGAYLSGGFVVAAAMDVVEEQQPQGGLGDLGNRVRMATDVMRADRNANLSRWHFIPAHLTPVTVLK